MVKRFIKISYVITAIFVSLLLLIYLLFNTKSFQNYLAQTIIKKVKEQFNVTIMLNEISYDGWSYFSLRNVGIADVKNDTLFYAGKLQFDITGVQVDSLKFTLNNLMLDEGLCKIIWYPDGNWGMSVLDSFSRGPVDTTPATGPPFQLILKNLECMDTRFVLIDSTVAFTPGSFDVSNMHFYDIKFRTKQFAIIEDSLVFNVRNLSCTEQSGIKVKNFNTQAIISPTLMEFNKLFAIINNSKVGNYFSMNYDSYDDFYKFEDKVKLTGKLSNCAVDIKDVALFAPALNSYDYSAKVSGNFSGPLSKLRIRDIIAQHGSNTRFVGKANITGLPNIDETFMEITAEYATTNKPELEHIIDMQLPDLLSEFGNVHFKGQYTGFYKDFVSYGTFESAFGTIETDLNMKLSDTLEQSAYSGNLSVSNFNLGKLLNNAILNKITASASVKGKGLDVKSLNNNITANIKSIDVNNYSYSNIACSIQAFMQSIKGSLTIQDPNLILELNGLADLNHDDLQFKFNGNLVQANLKPLHLSPYPINLSTKINSNFSYNNINNNNGNITLSDLLYDKNGYIQRINQLQLLASPGKITLNGDFIQASLIGDYHLETLYDQLYNSVSAAIPNYLNPVIIRNELPQNFELKALVSNTQPVSALFFEDVVATDLNIQCKVNTLQKNTRLMGYAANLKLGSYNFVQPSAKIQQGGLNQMNILAGLKSLTRNDTSFLGDMVFNSILSSNMAQNVLLLKDTTAIYSGEIKSKVNFYKDSLANTFEPSFIASNNLKLNIDTTGFIAYHHGLLEFENQTFFNKQNLVIADGIYNPDHDDINTTFLVKKLQLNTINFLVPSLNIQLNGLCNGLVQLKTIQKHLAIVSSLKVNQLQLDGDTLGSYVIRSDLSDNAKALNVDFYSTEGKIKNLKGEGTINLADNLVNLQASFERSDILAFQPFVKDYLTLFEGRAAMSVNITGDFNQPDIFGNLGLTGVKMRIEYLKTTYTFGSTLNFNKNLIEIEPFKIFDTQKNFALVNGTIEHKNFLSYNYNINISDFKNFEILNTTAKDNDLFYGKALATGNAQITGKGNNVQMTVNATSNKGTSITISPFSASVADGSSIINYVNYADTIPGETYQSKTIPLGFGIKLNLNATPDAEIKMIFDPTADDNIKATGRGKLTLELTPQGNFLMNGDYTLSQGEYRFTAVNVVNKKFTLKPGSNIVWNGDPLNGKLDITGLYNLRTTVSEIIRLPEGSNNQSRIPVECIINIKGIVQKPVIEFDLNFPELNNYITGNASSELNAVLANFRREPDLMNQQILFLLISGKFIPVNNNARQNEAISQQTVNELVSRSASSLLNSLLPNTDISIDLLNAADPTRGRAYLLSYSKKFLDNRLELQGSYATDNSQNNFTASYNIRKNGSLKSRIFNRNGLDLVYNRNITTSGVGLYYRKEFDKFIELFKSGNKYVY